MSIETNKLMNLADGKVLYDDLRERVDAKYAKPVGGIPSTDLASGVQTSLGKADTAYQKPADGIPLSDLADGVVDPTEIASEVTNWLDDNVPTGQTVVVDSSLSISGAAADSKKTGDELNELKSAINVLEPSASSSDVGKFLKAKTVSDGKVTEYEFGSASGGGVSDVQVNGTSVVSQGVANVPKAGNDIFGVVKVNSGDTAYGIHLTVGGTVETAPATDANCKAGSATNKPITPNRQHQSVFYGLAKAAGDSTQSASDNAVGTYTESAKSAISDMLNAPETVSGSTPSITAKSGVRYICGEVATLTVVVPASGIIDVVFESGSTPTVLTVTPPTGMTMRWIGDDPTALEANKHYEINIMDGCNGMVVSWS